MATSQGSPGPARTWKRQSGILPQSRQRDLGSADALTSDSGLQPVREYRSVVLSPVCGHLSWQPQEASAWPQEQQMAGAELALLHPC